MKTTANKLKKLKKQDVALIVAKKSSLKKTSLKKTAENPQRISKTSTSKLKSIIGDSAEEIQQLLEVNNNDSATSLMQKKLLQSLIDVLPLAENTIRETGGSRGVYQFNSLITSLREIIIDIQAVKDKGALGDSMVDKVVRPAFLDIGMTVVLEDERMLKEIKSQVDSATYKAIREIHSDGLKRIAMDIQQKYGEAKQKAIAFLQQ